MRITFLVPIADLSGGARVISIYAEALAARGHDVQVVIAGRRRLTLRNRLGLIRRGRAPWQSPPGPSHYDRLGGLVKRLSRPGAIRPGDCPDADVVVATWWETAEWMAAMPASKGRHVHFVQHYEAFGNMPASRVDAVLRAPTTKITISRWLDNLLRDDFGNARVHLVPNGVDLRQFHAAPRDRSSVPTIGMLYSTTAWKNCGEGFAAFERFRTHHPAARLITFGVEAEQPTLPLPDGTRHHVAPAQDRIKDVYAACDVWLCPSEGEGFHLPPLEAMACRCPVISTPVGGPADIIEEGKNGFLVPFHDSEAMAQRLQDFFALPADTWRAMSDAAHGTAMASDWAHAIDRFEQILRNEVRLTH